MIRLIIRVDSCMPDGTNCAPTYRTADIYDENLEKALQVQGYCSAAIVGAERFATSAPPTRAPTDG